jgi:hypothetical protein
MSAKRVCDICGRPMTGETYKGIVDSKTDYTFFPHINGATANDFDMCGGCHYHIAKAIENRVGLFYKQEDAGNG